MQLDRRARYALSIVVMTSARALDRIFAKPLRGEFAAWPGSMHGSETIAAAIRRLYHYGVAGLLWERSHLLKDWPDELIALIHEESLARAMWVLGHKQVIVAVLTALATRSVKAVLLKGTALAYSLYENPLTRFRGDSDLLIAEADLPAARHLLEFLRWQRPFGAPGAFGPLRNQEIWQYRQPGGFTHDIDLHWEVTNSRALRTVLDRKELLSQARPLPWLCTAARGPDPVTGLIHRAVDRAVHAQSGYFLVDRTEFDPDRLIWAVDLDHLAAQLTPEEWELLAQRSPGAGSGRSSVTRSGLPS